MKIVHVERLIDSGGFSETGDWKTIESQIISAIKAIRWPPGSDLFTLYDESGKKRGQGNGVTPIKEAFQISLTKCGWSLETAVDIATLKRPGPMDATCKVGNQLFCAEWETGNISSTHRALNKMALGILKGILVGGALIIPTRAMYKYLTDRVGNYPEIEPYFPLWKSLSAPKGLLVVVAIEHDAVSKSIERIKKGTDGRALV